MSASQSLDQGSRLEVDTRVTSPSSLGPSSACSSGKENREIEQTQGRVSNEQEIPGHPEAGAGGRGRA